MTNELEFKRTCLSFTMRAMEGPLSRRTLDLFASQALRLEEEIKAITRFQSSSSKERTHQRSKAKPRRRA